MKILRNVIKCMKQEKFPLTKLYLLDIYNLIKNYHIQDNKKVLSFKSISFDLFLSILNSAFAFVGDTFCMRSYTNERNFKKSRKPSADSHLASDTLRLSKLKYSFVFCLCYSGDPAGQRQPDPRHQPVQTAGEGRDSKRQQHVEHTETNRWVRNRNIASRTDR